MPKHQLLRLTNGGHTLVHPKDFERFAKYKWRSGGKKNLYVSRRRNGKTLLLHREIMNAPDGWQVDHINGNGLDNRRENLRLCSAMQNLWNSRKKTNTSGFKGVTKRASNKAFIARIVVNYKMISLGSFADPIDAAKAYDEAARKYFGAFARTNFDATTINQRG